MSANGHIIVMSANGYNRSMNHWQKLQANAKRYLEEDTYKVPAGVSNAAKRAQKWVADDKAGDGFTDTGRARMAQLARGGSVSRSTAVKMRAYFARHKVDKRATGFSSGEEGYPSPGRVAWDAWGGDAGETWVNGLALDD